MTNSKIVPYHNQPKEDTFLYRYVTIDKLLDFLINSRIPLVRLNIFEDKLEGVHVNHLLINYGSNKIGGWFGETLKHISINVNPTKRNSLRKQKEIFQNTNFASCWYMNKHESVAMWQLYSRPDSVAIRFPYKKLSEIIQSNSFDLDYGEYTTLKFGIIDYHNFNDIDELGKIVIKEDSIGFIKDKSFEHEQEFRILVEYPYFESPRVKEKPMILAEHLEKLNDLLDVKVLYLNLPNFNSLPFEIIFHPQSNDWHRQNISKILGNIGLPFKTSESSLKEILK